MPVAVGTIRKCLDLLTHCDDSRWRKLLACQRVNRIESFAMNGSQLLLSTERFRVEQVTRKLPGGQTRTRAIVRHPGAVAIIPMVNANHVCLINNYRVSVDR